MKEIKTYYFHEICFYKPDKSIRNTYNFGGGGRIRIRASRHESSTSDHLTNWNVRDIFRK